MILPITIDRKETKIPKEYPYQFVMDGAPRIFMQSIRSVKYVDKERLGKAIEQLTQPVRQLFESTTPPWFNNTLGPILKENHLTLDQLRPEVMGVLGANFAAVVDRLYDYPFAQELRHHAAQLMEQAEGTQPVFSALIKQLQSDDPQAFGELLTKLIQQGPDGLTLAAFLAKPQEELAKTTLLPNSSPLPNDALSTNHTNPLIDTYTADKTHSTLEAKTKPIPLWRKLFVREEKAIPYGGGFFTKAEMDRIIYTGQIQAKRGAEIGQLLRNNPHPAQIRQLFQSIRAAIPGEKIFLLRDRNYRSEKITMNDHATDKLIDYILSSQVQPSNKTMGNNLIFSEAELSYVKRAIANGVSVKEVREVVRIILYELFHARLYISSPENLTDNPLTSNPTL